MNELSYGDKIFKLLNKCNRNHHVPDLHSFRADTKKGSVYVDCRGFEVFIESVTYHSNGNEGATQWVGTLIAAANRLEALGMDLLSVEM